jgi:type VI secretion system secreted protein VgrG
MEQEGIYYFFEHENGKHTLILCDAPSAHKPIPNYGSIPFYPLDSSAVRDEYIHNWSINKSIQPGSYALKEYNFKKPMADLSAESITPEGHKTDDFEIFDYPGEYTESSEGDTYAKIRLQELHAGYEKKQGASDTRGLFAGGLFNLEKFSRKDQNREYLVTSVTHSGQQDIYTSNGNSEGNIYNNSFTLIESDRKFRTPRVTPKPIIQGLQTATVVGEDGDEIYTDEYGRIKCQFHRDRYGQFNQDSSCWIRVKHSWAGDKWGTIYIPRVGHEVVVEFLEGDPDRPLVTGEVYNKDKMPPYGLPANKTQSGIKSRSTKGGSSSNFNEIRMEDKKGKEQLYVHAEKNQDNIVEHDETTKVGRNRTETVGNDETITIEGNRTEIVGAGGSGNETITVTGNRTEIVGDGGNGGNESLFVYGNRIRFVEKNETIDIGDELHITATKEIILTVGESSLKMYKNGNIELSGVNITINSDATITETAPMIISEAKTSNTIKGGVVTSEAKALNTIKGAIVTLNP